MIKKEICQKLRDKKYTYQQIGDILGVSHQRIHQIITGYRSRPLKKKTPLKYFHGKTKGSGNGIDWIKFQGNDYIREFVRKRDNYTCQICNKVWQEGQRRFDVHHINCLASKTNKKYKNNKNIKQMITLCHKCHLNVKEHKDKHSKSLYIRWKTFHR